MICHVIIFLVENIWQNGDGSKKHYQMQNWRYSLFLSVKHLLPFAVGIPQPNFSEFIPNVGEVLPNKFWSRDFPRDQNCTPAKENHDIFNTGNFFLMHKLAATDQSYCLNAQ